MPTYTSGPSPDGGYITFGNRIQTNFTLPASNGNSSPNGTTYLLVTAVNVRARIPSGFSSTGVLFRCGTRSSTGSVAVIDLGDVTTTSYKSFSKTLSLSEQFMLAAGTEYLAGPQGTNNRALQSPRKASTPGFNIWLNDSIYTSSNPVTNQNQTYFQITYNSVPATPTNLTSGTVTGRDASIFWTKPSDGGSAITGYKTRFKVVGAASWTNSADISGDVSSGKVTGLSDNTNYEIQIAAYNNVAAKDGSAIGNWSSSITVKSGFGDGSSTATLSTTVLSDSEVTLTGTIVNNETTAFTATISGSGTISPSSYNAPPGVTTNITSSVSELSPLTEYTFGVVRSGVTLASAKATTEDDGVDLGVSSLTLSLTASTTSSLTFKATMVNTFNTGVTVVFSSNKGSVGTGSTFIPAGDGTRASRSYKVLVTVNLQTSELGNTATLTALSYFPDPKGLTTSTATATTPSAPPGTGVPTADLPIFTTGINLPAGKVGEAYSTTVVATGQATITYSKVSGPDWAVVNPNGVISGTPTAAGSIELRVKASYSSTSNTQETVRTFFISVSELSAYWSPETQNINEFAFLNNPYLSAFNAENVKEEEPYYIIGTLPPGLVFDKQTGDFSGTPTEAGVWSNIRIFATGKDNVVISKGPYTINVLYPGKRLKADGTFTNFANVYKFDPGAEGANSRGWKALTFMKKWNGNEWEFLENPTA
jgi:hypothetical protein